MSTATEKTAKQLGVDRTGRRRPYGEIRAEQQEEARRELHEQFGDDARIDPEDDPVAWRRSIRTHPALGPLYRTGVAVVGLLLILAGIPMIPLIGPGWAVVFVGLYVWSTEFIWARRVTERVKAEVKTFHIWATALPLKAKIPLGLVSAAVGWAFLYGTFMLTGVPGWIPDVVESRLVQLPGLGG